MYVGTKSPNSPFVTSEQNTRFKLKFKTRQTQYCHSSLWINFLIPSFDDGMAYSRKKNRITGFCLKPHNANDRAFVWFASKSTFKYTISTLIRYNIIEPHNKCHFEIIANGDRNRFDKLRIGHTMNH